MRKAIINTWKPISMALYGATLTSPIWGVIVGACVAGFAGAGIGLFAGPVAAIAAITVTYPIAVGVRKLEEKEDAAEREKLGYAPLPKVEKPKMTAGRALHSVKEFGKGVLRGLAWAGSFSIYIGTLGRVKLNIDGPAEASYEEPQEAASRRPSGLADKSITDTFAASQAPANTAKGANTQKPQGNQPKQGG